MYQKADCTLGSIIYNAICLRLTFKELTIERGFENRRVMACELLVNNEFLQERCVRALSNVDSDKLMRFSVASLEDGLAPRHSWKLTRIQDLFVFRQSSNSVQSNEWTSEKTSECRCLSPFFVLLRALMWLDGFGNGFWGVVKGSGEKVKV
jgi:hypothetical protein